MDGLGHSSIRHPQNPNRYLISRNRATGLVRPEDLMEMDLDSRPVDPTARSYSEVAIHAEIYKLRPDVHAVIHHHAPGTVSWGLGKIPMMPMNQSSRWMLDGVPFFDYRDLSKLIPGDQRLGGHQPDRHARPRPAVARALGASPALLLVNHGAVVVGASIYEAVGRSIYMEINTEVQTAAMLRGGEITYYDAAGELRATGARSDFARQWDLWKHDSCVKAGFCKPSSRPDVELARVADVPAAPAAAAVLEVDAAADEGRLPNNAPTANRSPLHTRRCPVGKETKE